MSIMLENPIFSGQLCISNCDLNFVYILEVISGIAQFSEKKVSTQYTWFDFLYKLIRNISNSEKNSARYHTFRRASCRGPV